MSRTRSYLRQNVLGLIAIFIALGGTAYAANTVGSSDIIDDSILSADIKTNNVRSDDIQGNAVSSSKLDSGAVQSIDVRDDTLAAIDLAPDSVGSSEIAQDAVGGGEVASDSLFARNISGVESLRGSGLKQVDDPVGGGSTPVFLMREGDFTVNAGCTDDGSGVVTARVTIAYDGPTGFAVTSDAPGGQTNTLTNAVVQLASLGPTTNGVLGSGTYTAGAPGAPLLSGVVTVGTHALATDCVFGVNALG
jgi:catabolite regulation protein CreA